MKLLRITIGNKSYEVTVEDLTGADGFPSGVAQPPSSAAPGQPSTAAPSVASAPVASAPVASAPVAKPQLPAEAGAVASPMAGVIKSVLVKKGESVIAGQSLAVLEAMKMENAITAPAAGTVKSIGVAAGDTVNEGHVLLVLE